MAKSSLEIPNHGESDDGVNFFRCRNCGVTTGFLPQDIENQSPWSYRVRNKKRRHSIRRDLIFLMTLLPWFIFHS